MGRFPRTVADDSSYRLREEAQRTFSRQNPAPYWSTMSLSPTHLAPHPLSLKVEPTYPETRERRGEARASCQSISDCSPRTNTTDDRVTVARPSDGPTDSSRRSRGADSALERETNVIIKDLGAAHRSASRQHRRATFLGAAPPRLRAHRGASRQRSAKSY